jgi:hypothetical protein
MDGQPKRPRGNQSIPPKSNRYLAMLCIACGLALGCRNDPYLAAHIELQNAARRSVEDQLYEAQFDAESKTKEIERLRKENEQLRKGRASTGSSSPATPSAGPDRLSVPDIQPPTIEMPASPSEPTPPATSQPEEELGPLRPPVVEPGTPTDPPASLPTSSGNPRGPARPGSNAAADRAVAMLDLNDPRVDQIWINSDLSAASDWDGRTGEDGINLVIEPRNREGKYLPLAGPVSIVVLNPAAAGEKKRFARWDLDSTQVDQQMRKSDNSRGIQLKLPWPERPPQDRRLQVVVRYVTADGRQLESASALPLGVPRRSGDQWISRGGQTAPSERTSPAPKRLPATAPVEVARPEWKPYR